jgi:hypothetical protein
MTLSVDAYRRFPDGTEERIGPFSYLAGHESMRRRFYGSDLSHSLGLRLLPRLKDIYMIEVEGTELNDLRAEVEALLASVSGTEAADYWDFRLSNILEAISIAKTCNGVVTIG